MKNSINAIEVKHSRSKIIVSKIIKNIVFSIFFLKHLEKAYILKEPHVEKSSLKYKNVLTEELLPKNEALKNVFCYFILSHIPDVDQNFKAVVRNFHRLQEYEEIQDREICLDFTQCLSLSSI